MEPLNLEEGLLCGTLSADGECRVFKGIPFAAPPVGQFRWREPQPAARWRGVLVADRFASACLQPLHSRDALMRQFGFADPPECGLSEDCLYLNVWAPARATSQRLPVIVWLHGGGHRVGSGSHPVSSGEGLARQGAVVVTVNYRLGALGYLAHPELTRESGESGNYACLDVLAALHWVKRNIVAFGGDSDCVTLFGQSAGAAILSVLMTLPQSQGLFHRAIAHSGGRFSGGLMGQIKSLCEAEDAGTEFAQGLGANTLADLRDLPADVTYGSRGLWNLIVDGSLVRQPPQVVFEQGRQMAIPLLCGFTRNEASPYPMTELHSRDAFWGFAQRTFAHRANELLRLFPCDSDAAALASSYELRRSMGFAYQVWQFALMQQRHAPVYLFEFDRAVPLPPSIRFREPVPPGGYGAYHGSELWYVFKTFSTQPWPWEEIDRRLADVMSSYWVNFARSGDPNNGARPQWPRFHDTGRTAMLLGDTVRSGAPSNGPALDFFSQHFNRPAPAT